MKWSHWKGVQIVWQNAWAKGVLGTTMIMEYVQDWYVEKGHMKGLTKCHFAMQSHGTQCIRQIHRKDLWIAWSNASSKHSLMDVVDTRKEHNNKNLWFVRQNASFKCIFMGAMKVSMNALEGPIKFIEKLSHRNIVSMGALKA